MNLAIYVSSYDGCKDLWDTFFEIFERYWSDCKYKIYLINNNIKYEKEKITIINTGDEVNWFDRTIKSLEQLDEKYIMFLLEDYFISKKISNDYIDKIISDMEENEIFFVRLSNAGIKYKRKYEIVQYNIPYYISLQPGIWNRKKLIDILKNIENGKTPWDFEVYFLKNRRKTNDIVKGVWYHYNDILGYKNGVLQGKWIRETLNFYKSKGINIDTKNRKIMSYKETFIYDVKKSLSLILSDDARKKLKKFLKKFGFKFVTEE